MWFIQGHPILEITLNFVQSTFRAIILVKKSSAQANYYIFVGPLFNFLNSFGLFFSHRKGTCLSAHDKPCTAFNTAFHNLPPPSILPQAATRSISSTQKTTARKISSAANISRPMKRRVRSITGRCCWEHIKARDGIIVFITMYTVQQYFYKYC